MQNRQYKCGCFASACLGSANEVLPGKRLGDSTDLNGRWSAITNFFDFCLQTCIQMKFIEIHLNILFFRSRMKGIEVSILKKVPRR